MTATRPLPVRRFDLDWLRIAAFGLLILYHVGLLYVPWPYQAKSRHSVPALVPLLQALNPWRLLLLFLISGVATRFMSGKLPLAQLLLSRSKRLLVPLVFGMFVIVPPQSFVQAIEQYGYTGDFNHFYWEYYLTGTQALCNTSGCLALPTWNHLWFVLYLYIYTILLVGLLMLARGIKYETRYAALPVLAFLTLPPLALAAARVLLYRAYPPNDALLNDWYSHAIYGGFFLFGYFAATVGGFWDAMKWGRWPALMAAVLLLPSVWLAGGVLLPAPLASLALPSSLGVPLYQWTAIVAVCGFGQRWLPRTDGPLRRKLTEAVFPFYIIHQTVLVLCAYVLRSLYLPTALEAVIILGVTAAACLGTFEFVQRFAVLRPLFGLRPLPEGVVLHAH
ncbi:MAG TPA: acyltransferase [Acidobacteriaceae bacterium]